MQALEADGISTGIHYPIPCHLQAAYAGLKSRPCPVAEGYASELLSLPMFPELTQDQIGYVAERLQAFLRKQAAGR